MADPAKDTKNQEQEDPQIALVRQALAEAGSSIQEAKSKQRASVDKTESMSDQIVNSINNSTLAKQTIARTTLTADMQTQNANLDILEATGGRAAQIERLTELTKDEEQVDFYTKRHGEIMKREHTGLAPIDFFINAFGSIGNSVMLGQAKNERNQTLNEITNIGAATDTVFRTNAHTKKAITEDSIAANLSQIASENAVAASEQSIKNTFNNSRAMAELIGMDNQQVSNRLQSVRLSMEEDQMELTRERHKLSIEQLKFQQEEFKVRLPQMQVNLESSRLALEEARALNPSKVPAMEANYLQQKREVDDLVALQNQQVTMVQRGQASVLGESGIEPRETIIANINRGGAMGAKYEQYRNIGSTPDAVLGGTPAEAAQVLSTIDPENRAPKTKYSELLSQIKLKQTSNYQAAAAKGLAIPNDPAQIASDFNNTAKSYMKEFASNIMPGIANPYSAPPMESLAPALENKNIALYNKVIKPLNLTEATPQVIIDSAVAGIQSKRITPEQAASGIAAMYSTAAAMNNTMNGGFNRVGLPSQLSYNTAVTKPVSIAEVLTAGYPSILGGSDIKVSQAFNEVLGKGNLEIVNMMDEVAVTKLISKMMSTSLSPNPATATNVPNNPAPKLSSSGE